MNLLLATHRYSDFVRGEPSAVQAIQSAAKIFIPFIVLGELRAGFLHGNRARENESTLTRILQRPSVSVLYADGDTTHHYALIYQQLRQRGTPVPTNDLWIAALAVQYELVLFSRDPHFQHVPQIARL
ncbi:MAG TPA: type II toxin-antitoxin system VapC family toxin [Tepidisphaeraceae bacterium]|nr:type II toxin-antitoxin system VapC family toxin [Tepidisphaeraceae bacterium]